MNTQTKELVWIGMALVDCPPDNDILGGAKGAYVNVLAVSNDADEFVNKVQKAVKDLGLIFKGIEDVETFEDRMERFTVDKQLKSLAKEALKSKSLRFSSFHTFDM